MGLPEPGVGAKAPAFSGETQDGGKAALGDFLGRPVVLFFYPKDATPGCTTEACGFRDEFAAFRRAGAAVLGISPDTAASHARFAAKHSLPYPLVADPEKKIVQAYGVWGEKTLYGRKYLGVTRTTFVIDAAGRIARVFRKVKPEGHAAEVLAAVLALVPETRRG